MILLIYLLPALTPAAVLKTLDGKTHEGDGKFDSGGFVLTPPATGPPLKIELDDILQATFKTPDPAPIRAAIPRTENGQLPPPWTAINVGTPADAEPYARYRTESGYSIKCRAGDIGKTSDSLVFVQQPSTGDADLVCRFDDVAHPTRVAAGLMFRQSSDDHAPYVAILHAAGELKFLKREKRGGPTQGGAVQPTTPFPVWLRLLRKSNTITAYTSDDGTDWTRLATDVVPLGPTALAGIAVCSRENTPMGTHAQALRLTALQSAAAPVAPSNLPPGLVLRTGTLLARAQIHAADDGSIRFSTPARRDASVTNLQVARIIFRELTPDMASRIPAGRTGVLLKTGDFVEGEFKGIKDGKILLSSVLFGVQRFAPGDQAACAVLGDPEPARAQFIIRTDDGSTYTATSATVEKDKLVIQDPLAGKFSISQEDLQEITAGPGKLQPLASIKPSRIDAAPGTSPSDACTIPAPSRLTISGGTPTNPILLRAGSSASWNVAGEYRLLTFKAAVPDAVAPTAPVRFIVLADNKPLYKSPPRTSADPPLAVSLSLKQVQTLTLKVDSTSQHIPTPALWSEASLVK